MENNLFKNGFFVFIKEIFSNPRAIGAALPSSNILANRMAMQVQQNQIGSVLELGAGTGVITNALLKSGLDPEKIIVIERAEALANLLKKRFPGLNIIHGDAAKLLELIGDDKNQIHTVISSLPLRSLPKPVVSAIIHQLEAILKPGDRLIQYTYSMRKEEMVIPQNFKRILTKTIWFNIPPARIDVFEYQG